MIFIFFVVYFLFLILLYIFIIQRLKNLSYKHMNDTGLASLWRGYIIIKRRLIVILILMFILSSFLVLTIF